MSKKELLERLSRTSSAESRTRRAEPAPPAEDGAEVTTRVSRRVIRRRRVEKPEPTSSPAVVRRRAADPDRVAPRDEEVEVSQAEEAPPAEAAPPTPSEAPVSPVEEPAAAEAPPAEAPAAPEAPEAPPAELEPERMAIEAAGKAKPDPAAPQEPQAAEAPAEVPSEAPAEAPADEDVPERPRYEGLGKAVVMPPPGYDPTNPAAYRRRVQQQQAAPRPAAAPAEEPGFSRRRQVPAEEREARPRRARRGRQPAMGDRMGMRRRPRRKTSGPKAASPAPKASKRKVRVDNVISVGQLAHELGVKAAVVIKELMGMGQMATVNEMLDVDTASLVASEFDYEVENVGFQETQFLQHAVDEDEEEAAEARPPVVTVMGHVDHGKTTLIDALREARVASGEAGGITQHIGAYQVEIDGQKITFIDTPGHAAFTAMRARGAGVTDLVILVVAADDGVQTQTAEAISHAKAAGVPILVAINKMDKAGVSVDPIKQKLSEHDLLPEDWGGDTMFVPISALKRQGLEELLEAVLLQSEVLELAANPDRPAEGAVIEAKLERGRGVVATLLVQKGTLKRGDNVVIGATYGRVRAMLDHRGKQVKEAGPSTPIEIFGLNDIPEVGDSFHVVKTEKDARTVAEHRAQERRTAAMAQTGRRTAADIFASAEAASRETLNIILKADVQGSLEALRGAMLAIEVEGAEARILHAGVGDISESDINLAAANGAMLIGFNVKLDAMARQAADAQGVQAELHDVIYSALDQVKARMTGLLAPEYEQVKRGVAEIRAIFAVSKYGKIAGCYVQEGKVGRNHGARVLRDGQVLWEGRIQTLKRFKDDVREVSSGYECGISLDGFNDIAEGDLIETFTMEEVPAAG